MSAFRMTCILLGLGTSILLSGCGNDNDGSKATRSYIQKKRAEYQNKETQVSPLKDIPATSYQATKLRNPFERPKAKRGKKYPNAILQSYGLSSLQLVGTMTDPNSTKTWAFLRTSDGKIYKIIKGSRVGSNYALVTQIDRNQVKFIEEQESDDGELKQRTFTLTLQKVNP